jgi:hypothetical protein
MQCYCLESRLRDLAFDTEEKLLKKITRCCTHVTESLVTFITGNVIIYFRPTYLWSFIIDTRAFGAVLRFISCASLQYAVCAPSFFYST